MGLLLVKLFFNVIFCIYWCIGWRVPFHWNSFTVTQELGVVPFNIICKQTRLFMLQIDIQRMSSSTIDMDFIEQIKISIFTCSKCFDLLIKTRFLTPKLVTRKSKHTKTLLTISILQFDHLSVIGLG